jgi:hypothetical protein
MEMKRIIPILAALALSVGAGAVNYSTDFEADAVGTLPDGWYLATPWGDWAPGPITAAVQAAPGGGQALKVVWGTDWESYGASSGETGYTLDMTGLDPENSILSVSYDFNKVNWRVWQMFGDQTYVPPGGIHMNDDPNKPNWMYVGRDGGDTPDLSDVPENMWIHVESTFDSATNQWNTSVGWTGGGGNFNGISENAIAGQYWFGGWAFQSTMDAAPIPPGGQYFNSLFIDNFSFEVIPEPAALMLLGVGVLALRRR